MLEHDLADEGVVAIAVACGWVEDSPRQGPRVLGEPRGKRRHDGEWNYSFAHGPVGGQARARESFGRHGLFCLCERLLDEGLEFGPGGGFGFTNGEPGIVDEDVGYALDCQERGGERVGLGVDL